MADKVIPIPRKPHVFGAEPLTESHEYHLDGLESFPEIGALSDYNFIQNTGIYTISTWIKLDDYTPLIAQVITGNEVNAAEKGFAFFYDNRVGVNNALSMLILDGTGTQMLAHEENGAITDNNLHFVQAIGDGVNNQFYVDGVAHGSPKAFGAFSTGNPIEKLAVGTVNDTRTIGLIGNLNNVSYFNTDKSASSLAFYNSGCPTDLSEQSGLKSWWRLGEDAIFTGGNWTENDLGPLGNNLVSELMEEPDRVAFSC